MVQFTNIAINTININRCSSKAQWYISFTYRHWTHKCFNNHETECIMLCLLCVIRTHCYVFIIIVLQWQLCLFL